jgi:hypothetical protein
MSDDSGWDHSAVSNTIDLLGALKLIANRYVQMADLYGFLTETDAGGNEVTNFYVKCSRTFSGTVPMWEAQMAKNLVKMKTKTGTGAGTGVCAHADSSNTENNTGSQIPPAMMGAAAGPNPNLGPRVNYPGIGNYMLPELFSMDFSMDDAWYNDILPPWDMGTAGLATYSTS